MKKKWFRWASLEESREISTTIATSDRIWNEYHMICLTRVAFRICIDLEAVKYPSSYYYLQNLTLCPGSILQGSYRWISTISANGIPILQSSLTHRRFGHYSLLYTIGSLAKYEWPNWVESRQYDAVKKKRADSFRRGGFEAIVTWWLGPRLGKSKEFFS